MIIFISYRRDDSADVSGRIYDRLVAHFGADSLFKDVDDIPFGVNFKEHIESVLVDCDVVLVIIGPDWVRITDMAGRCRLDDPTDFVRIEVESALQRNIPVIPVLVRGAVMPAIDDLPLTMAELAYRHGLSIRRDPDFHHDMDRLIGGLEHYVSSEGERTPEPASPSWVDDRGLPVLEWCEIPPGRVQICDNQGNPLGAPFKVEPFRMAKYPVTHAQYQAFIDAPDGYFNDAWWDGLAASEEIRLAPAKPTWPIDNHPRDSVSWYEAVAFCRWLSARFHCEVRLPAEWEWLWAAQGGAEQRSYPWGSEFDPGRCNTKENGIERTTPVDQHPEGASRYGVMDMAGNVWEWCLSDYYNPGRTETSGDDPRVMHGGTWRADQKTTRSDWRGCGGAGERGFDQGFRVVTGPAL